MTRVFEPYDQYQNLLTGLGVADDAAVYRMDDDTAVIQTIDFFPPVLDDPYDYGAAAAANAMSDVYAMGGEVTLALNVCAFPNGLDQDVIGEILRGGAETVKSAGAIIAGGHTVVDDEVKYGLSVMGIVHPDRIMTKSAARPGDVLVLTKSLGVGVITTALKQGSAESSHVQAAADSMKVLNRDAARLFATHGVRGCTDITGYSILGHGWEMADSSGVRLRLSLASLPFLDGARGYAERGVFPGGTRRNRDAFHRYLSIDPSVDDTTLDLLLSPETSGGLLAAVHADRVDGLLDDATRARVSCDVVGEVVTGAGVEICP